MKMRNLKRKGEGHIIEEMWENYSERLSEVQEFIC